MYLSAYLNRRLEPLDYRAYVIFNEHQFADAHPYSLFAILLSHRLTRHYDSKQDDDGRFCYLHHLDHRECGKSIQVR